MVRTSGSRDIRRAFYTRSEHILRYMLAKLRVEDGLSVFDPCAGGGDLIDAVLSTGRNVRVTAYELDKEEATELETKYSTMNNVCVRCRDTLLEPTQGLFGIQRYDRIVANPPYGAWQSPERRALLKKLYPGMYVRETYGLFLFKCLESLYDGGRLVFITPDTYLNLNFHKKLRERILTTAAVEEIVMFPTKFFPGQSFGYSNLSIITLHKPAEGKVAATHNIKVIKGLHKPADLSLLASHAHNRHPTNIDISLVSQRDVYENVGHAFFLDATGKLADYIGKNSLTVGDVADVVTGFYSGDDAKYLKRASTEVRGRKRYEVVDHGRVTTRKLPPLDGIEGSKCFIPIVKGGNIPYVKPNHWFLDWSKEAVLDYRVRNKKARFQNSRYYFREGLAVPMVTSSKISGALLENRLFDQSTVGIFPKDKSLTHFLLGFFNSRICDDLIRTINPSANNSANYLKQIPFKLPTIEQKSLVEMLVRDMIDDIRRGGEFSSSKQEKVDQAFADIYHCA